MLPFEYDFLNPDINKVFRYRQDRLHAIRTNPDILPILKTYYRENIADFITDWGCTYDPRNIERGLSPIMPFILFPRQIEFVEFITNIWRSPVDTQGLSEKSRDCGLSWLSVAFCCSMCMFFPGFSAGFGSRKEEYVDKIGHPKSLFWKARKFMEYLPREFKGSWTADKHTSHMKLIFPDTGASITGEAGNNIGRGDRTSIYVVDESAHLENPELIDAALSMTTNCRIDISSVNGPNNSFAKKRKTLPDHLVFVFDWREDPRKTQEWYDEFSRTHDPLVVAQEIDRDYYASVEGVVIPNVWVQAAIDAHLKLQVKISGPKIGALDVADEGTDKNAFAVRQGILLFDLDEWSGKGGDIYDTTEKAFMASDRNEVKSFRYDADGIGSGVRGDARKINERRAGERIPIISVHAFKGSGSVHEPEKDSVVSGWKNEDYFENFKAQAWWSLRLRFYRTWQAVTKGMPFKPDEIISLSSELPYLSRLTSELSQPIWTLSKSGKILIQKKPDGTKSPNLADAVNILYSPFKKALHITDATIATISSL